MFDESDSSDDEGQAFYAGGSEHSGQQVLGPSKKNKKDLVSEIFKSAKERGAEVVESNEKSQPSKILFSGAGYKLGDRDDDFEVIPAPSGEFSKPKEVTLKMWKAGFSVDEGPLRAYEDPSNSEFLNSVRKSEIPHELIKEARGGEVYLNMEDHRHEEFAMPKQNMQAFSGSGHTLGSCAPSVFESSSVVPKVDDAKTCEEKARTQLGFSSEQPSTNIQVKLSDGSRLIVKLNHTHTVRDIRDYILCARPHFLYSSFALMTTFPHQEITNEDQTVAEANLLNATIVMKNK